MQSRPPTFQPSRPPVCILAHRESAVRASIEVDGRTVERIVIAGVDEAGLRQLVERHRAAFDEPWSPAPNTLWATATERFLSEVYQLVSRHLVNLLARFPRVELKIADPALVDLPIEAAHGFGTPALFDLCQIYRGGLSYRHPHRGPRRSFRLDVRQGDSAGLHGLTAEQSLIRSSYQQEPDLASERIVHVCGHEPTINAATFEVTERAHVVLSGCDSLPRFLPPGVASVTGTLWPIDDHTNAATVALLHSRIALGVGPAEALRQAQLLQRPLSPQVWAAYAHIGQPD